jgi:hypothetical protein
MYLGQLVVHNAFSSFGVMSQHLDRPRQWGYFACFLVGAVGLVVIGDGLRSRMSIGRLRGAKVR